MRRSRAGDPGEGEGARRPGAASDPALWLVLLALLALAAAYAGVCWSAGSLWPWSAVVHEDGRRTLLGTVFYFEHGTRELPLDLVLAVAVAGAARRRRGVVPPRLASGAAALAGATLLVVLAGTLLVAGPEGLAANLAQRPTRGGEAGAWGAHWRFHLLSRAALLGLAAVLATVVARAGAAPPPDAAAGRGLRRAAWLLFALGTLAFVPTSEPFVDPVFLGHQARELLTHALVTVPLALGLALRARGPVRFARPRARDLPGPAIVVLLAVALYLGGGTLWTDAVSRGQSDDLAVLLFPHFFEHAFGYVLVPAAAVWLASLGERGKAAGSDPA